MARGAASFRQSDLTKALKAAKAAGFAQVEIDPKTGRLLVTGQADDKCANLRTSEAPENEWDNIK